MKNIILSIAAILSLTSCGLNSPGNGEKVGQIVRLSKHGIFNKTWEAQINLIYEVPPFINEQFCSLHRGRLLCKGFIDSLCADLKKDLGIKKVDKWLKEKYGKSKNELRYDDGLKIKADFPQVNFETKNFYEQYGWKDDIRANYIWPV